MTRGDKLLTLGILVFVVIGFMINGTFAKQGAKSQNNMAIIKVEDEIIKSVTLPNSQKDWHFTVKGKMGPAIIEVNREKIRMHESPCPDQICVHRGWIDSPGETIICVPNRVVITIQQRDKGIDGITQ